VQLARRRVAAGRASAVLVHAGNANACTGAEGLRTALDATALAARLLDVAPADVVPCATGRIGVQVPREQLLAGVRAAAVALAPAGFSHAAEAITTTDAFPKTALRELVLGGRRVTVAALGKGAGMIAPDMATLLVFVVTDAAAPARVLRATLGEAVDATLNAITVDGDMSTNDTVLLLAGGAAANVPIAAGSRQHAAFTRAVTEVLDDIARLVVLDGEGGTRMVEVLVRGARSGGDARRVARAVAESTLCKAAFHGGDPNWGRFVCAAGTAGAALDPDRVDVTIGDVTVARRGRPVPGALGRAAARMRRTSFRLGLARPRWFAELGRGLGVGLAGVGVALLVCMLAGGVVPELRFAAAKTLRKALLGCAAAIAIGTGEELLFRGVLLHRMARDVGRVAAVILTALVYAAVHAVRTRPACCSPGLVSEMVPTATDAQDRWLDA